jgi:hypothetical protein
MMASSTGLNMNAAGEAIELAPKSSPSIGRIVRPYKFIPSRSVDWTAEYLKLQLLTKHGTETVHVLRDILFAEGFAHSRSLR